MPEQFWRFTCSTCGFRTAYVQRAENHEQRSGHDVWENDETTEVGTMTDSPQQDTPQVDEQPPAVIEEPDEPRGAYGWDDAGLTTREREAFNLLARGFNLKDAGTQMGVTKQRAAQIAATLVKKGALTKEGVGQYRVAPRT